jgi:ABC-type branched-subunit amino acid transport system permease subunit
MASSFTSDALIIIGCIIGALVFLFIVTRSSGAPARKESNDFTGAVVAVIGTTYAVILAFMLSGVWNMFQQAQANEEQEANSLVNIWRIATQLDVPESAEAQAACLKYADNAVQKEWPAMLAGKPLPMDNTGIINQLWKFAGQVQRHSGNDSIAAYQMMEELRMLTEYRRIRIVQSREGLPAILWAVLIVGGVITVAAACFFGVPSFRFHVLQVAVLSFLISLVLVAIADIDRPYQGAVTVQPEGFSFSRETITGQHPR